MGNVYIGTSGWVYKDWQKHFYPADIPARAHFQYYATHFPTVEINATFYRLPTLNMIKGLRKYFNRIKPMQKRIGPILWQLPPFMKKSPERLEKFLKILPKTYCHAIEFRHPSWYEVNEAFDLLRRYKAAHVNLSSLRMPMNLTVTADFAYIRFHGLQGGAAHDYTRAELEPWADFLRKQSRAGKNCYAYFNNDVNVHAPDNAKMLMQMVGKATVKPTKTIGA